MRSEIAAELNLSIQKDAEQPIPVQLTAEIRKLVARGTLTPGDPIPSTRALAAQLGVARGTVVAAYEQLQGEGYLISERGSGTCINPHLHPVQPTPPPSKKPKAHKSLLPLSPGAPDTSTLVDPTWRAAWREAASQTRALPAAGAYELREEISHHVRHMRGLVAEPERIIIASGAREGLMVLLHALGPQLKVGVESPGYPSLRKIPGLLGHRLQEVGTDEHGIRTDQLGHMDALIVTPSHQYPTGGSLPAQRRTALAEWACRRNTLLIEDDYDSELRYAGQPLPALAALAPNNTALLGTFSTLISPSIACGYIVMPPDLVEAGLRVRELLSQPAGTITQIALARYMASGALRRRTQRLRRLYAKRRDIVTEELSGLAHATLRPIHGGLHAVVLCERDAHEVVRACAAQGLGVTALSEHWGGSGVSDNGVVFGFGAHSDEELRRALRILAGELRIPPA